MGKNSPKKTVIPKKAVATPKIVPKVALKAAPGVSRKVQNQRKRAYLKRLLILKGKKKASITEASRKKYECFMKNALNAASYTKTFDALKKWRFSDARGDFKLDGKYGKIFDGLMSESFVAYLGNNRADLSKAGKIRCLNFLKEQLRKRTPGNITEVAHDAFIKNILPKFADHLAKYERTFSTGMNDNDISKALRAYLGKGKGKDQVKADEQIDFKKFSDVHTEHKTRLSYSDLPGMVLEMQKNVNIIPVAYVKYKTAIQVRLDKLKKNVDAIDFTDKDKSKDMVIRYTMEYRLLLKKANKTNECAILRKNIAKTLIDVARSNPTLKSSLETKLKKILISEKLNQIDKEKSSLAKLASKAKQSLSKVSQRAKKDKYLATLNDAEKKLLKDKSILTKKLAIPVFGGVMAAWYVAKNGIRPAILKKLGIKVNALVGVGFMRWAIGKNRAKTLGFFDKAKNKLTGFAKKIPFFGQFFAEKASKVKPGAAKELNKLIKAFKIDTTYKEYFKTLKASQNMKGTEFLKQVSVVGFPKFNGFKAVVRQLYKAKKVPTYLTIRQLFSKLKDGDVLRAQKVVKNAKKTNNTK